MGKSPDAFRTIGEVAEWLEEPPHVLRFWETRFPQIRPVKRAGGRRYYRPRDALILGGIKKLLHEDGMTIRGAQKLIRENGVRWLMSLSRPLDTPPPGETIEANAAEGTPQADEAPPLEGPPPVEETTPARADRVQADASRAGETRRPRESGTPPPVPAGAEAAGAPPGGTGGKDTPHPPASSPQATGTPVGEESRSTEPEEPEGEDNILPLFASLRQRPPESGPSPARPDASETAAATAGPEDAGNERAEASSPPRGASPAGTGAGLPQETPAGAAPDTRAAGDGPKATPHRPAPEAAIGMAGATSPAVPEQRLLVLIAELRALRARIAARIEQDIEGA